MTDLRYTSAVLIDDRNRWAHAGPGATRGGSRVLYGEPDRLSQASWVDQQCLTDVMTKLLRMSRRATWWVQNDPDWPRWEMREVEHTLCEFDKYERVRRGQGRAKRSFDASAAQKRLLPDAGLGGL